MDYKNMEEACFQIISNSGAAKSNYIEAMNLDKHSIEQAEEMIKEGENYYKKAHKVHFDLVTREAQGENIELTFLYIHAETQLMSAEIYNVMSKKYIQIYEMGKKQNNNSTDY